jgi:hypothetical protein
MSDRLPHIVALCVTIIALGAFLLSVHGDDDDEPRPSAVPATDVVSHPACKDHGGFKTYQVDALRVNDGTTMPGWVQPQRTGNLLYCKDGSIVMIPEPPSEKEDE